MVHSLMLYRIERSYNFGDFTSSDSIMLVHLFAVALVTMITRAVTTVKLRVLRNYLIIILIGYLTSSSFLVRRLLF